MSGHITTMSRGSRVGSSSSSPSSTSRSTSTWRAAPWQLCTCTERSAGVSCRPSGRTALARRSAWSQPSMVAGASGSPWWRSVASAATAARLRWSSRTSRPRVASSGWPTSRWLRSSARGTAPVDAAQGLPQVVARVREPEVEVVVGGERGQQRDLGARHPGVAEEREPRRQVARPSPGAGRRSRRGARAAAVHRPSPTRARHSGGCQLRSAASSPPAPSLARPSSQSTSSCGRWTAYDENRPASRRATE